jgi:hypothetical protein
LCPNGSLAQYDDQKSILKAYIVLRDVDKGTFKKGNSIENSTSNSPHVGDFLNI